MLDGWMPYAIIAVAAAVLVAGTVLLARMAWRRQVRRYVVALMSRRAAIEAALKTVAGVLADLAGGTVDDLLAFATADSEERRAVAEIAERMRVEAAELADLSLPKKLWSLADQLGVAAAHLATEAGRVGDSEGDAALDALLALDLEPVGGALAAAEGLSATAATIYGVTDPSVYGGGLYI